LTLRLSLQNKRTILKGIVEKSWKISMSKWLMAKRILIFKIHMYAYKSCTVIAGLRCDQLQQKCYIAVATEVLVVYLICAPLALRPASLRH